VIEAIVPRSRQLSRWRRAGARLLMVMMASGCYTWRIERVAPESLLAQQPRRVRVTRTDGTHAILTQPTLQADALTSSKSRVGQSELLIPLTEVRTLESRRFSVGGTLGLGVALFGAYLMAAIIATTSNPP